MRFVVIAAVLSAVVVLLLAVFGGYHGQPATVAAPESVVVEPPSPTEVAPVSDLRTVLRPPLNDSQSPSTLLHATTVQETTSAEVASAEQVDLFDATRENCEALAEEGWGFIAQLTVREMRELIAEEASWRRAEVFVEPRWMEGVPGDTDLGEAAGEFVRWDDSPTLRAAFAEFQQVRRQRAARQGPDSTDVEGFENDGAYIGEVLGPQVIDASGLGARRLYDLVDSFRYLELTEEIE